MSALHISVGEEGREELCGAAVLSATWWTMQSQSQDTAAACVGLQAILHRMADNTDYCR